MTIEHADVVVVGGGPAGLSAAIEAARAGASVTVLEENARPGGQIYRQLPAEFSVEETKSITPEHIRGQELFAELARHPVRFEGSALAWGCFEHNVLEVVSNHRAWRLRAKAIIVASGAYDRPVPLPGWTLPGVFTVGGAQTLLKAQRMLPGRRILLAGTGPLLLVVASQLAKAGANIVAVVDPVPTRALLPHAVAMLRGWPLLKDGLRYRYSLVKARVPWLAPFVITSIEGDREVEQAVIARADSDWGPLPGSERRLNVDAVCLGYGLVPSVELLRLLGCQLNYDGAADVWLPQRTRDCETSVAGVFAVGDGAGVAGVRVAIEEGRIAGIAAARQIGKLSASDAEAAMSASRSMLERLYPFGAAMSSAYRPRPGLRELATPATVICRCEEVTREEIERAVSDGAASPTQVKAWTRCGMGSCQARMCSLPTVHLVAHALGRPVEEIGTYPPGPPVKPVAVSALIRELETVDAGSNAGRNR